MLPCKCGGVLYTDTFEHPMKPIEWFLRCKDCGEMTPSGRTEKEAINIARREVKRDSRKSVG